MNLISLMRERFLRYLIRKRGKSLIIGKNCTYNSKCQFEGYNKLDDNLSLANTKVGYGTTIGKDGKFYATEIGRFTCIGQRVKTIVGGHPIHFVSIHPAFYSIKKQTGFTYVGNQKFDEIKYVDESANTIVKIGSDVWIGDDVRIVNGVTIGHGAVILAGAVVTKDVPPYAIAGGIPAKVRSFRFDEKTIGSLLNIKWWDKDISWIESKSDYFDNIEVFLKMAQKDNCND